MLSIEECLERLDTANWSPPRDAHGHPCEITDPWDRRFLSDICVHTRQGKALSTAQSEIALKMVRKHIRVLEVGGIARESLDVILQNPNYRQPLYQSRKLPREVRWIGRNQLAFRCKFNPIVVEELKKLHSGATYSEFNNPRFNKEYKLWIVLVTQRNLDRTMELIRRHNFSFDPLVETFFLESVNALETPATEVRVDEDHIEVDVRNDEFLQTLLHDTAWLDA